MAGLNQSLAPAVAPLLSQIPCDCSTWVMPDQRRRLKANLPASIEEAPAEVDVVAGEGIDGVEPSELLKS
jgi:hypothetical protein